MGGPETATHASPPPPHTHPRSAVGFSNAQALPAGLHRVRRDAEHACADTPRRALWVILLCCGAGPICLSPHVYHTLSWQWRRRIFTRGFLLPGSFERMLAVLMEHMAGR
jgi:hypothetical protein